MRAVGATNGKEHDGHGADDNIIRSVKSGHEAKGDDNAHAGGAQNQ